MKTQTLKRKIITHLLQVSLTVTSVLGFSGTALSLDLNDFGNFPVIVDRNLGNRIPDIQDGSSNTIDNGNIELNPALCELLRRRGEDFRNLPNFPGRPNLTTINCPDENEGEAPAAPEETPPAPPVNQGANQDVAQDPELSVQAAPAAGGCSMMVGGSGIPWTWSTVVSLIPLWVLRRLKKKN